MFSYSAAAALPPSSIFAADSAAIPDPIANLLNGSLTNIKYLVEVYPYDSTIVSQITLHPAPFSSVPSAAFTATQYGGINPVYLSDHVFITKPTDTIANVEFKPLVESPLQYDFSIWSGDTIGVNNASYGSIEVINYSGELDSIVDKSYTGRRVVIKGGYDGFNYAEYATVFDGLANEIEYDDRGIIFTISDKSLLMERALLTPIYQGTGGLEGGADIKGDMKPIALGKCFNIEPVLVDGVNLIYQCHFDSMAAVTAVFDSGVALTFDADVADITTATPSAGEYATSLATGFIKLGSTPTGRITANVQGDNDGGYVESLGGVCKRIGTKLYDYLSFPADDFTSAWDLLTDSVGIYVREQTTMRQLYDTLLNPCGAYWLFDRTGKLDARLIAFGDSGTSDLNVDIMDDRGLEMVQRITPAWKITVAYAPVFTVQNESEMAGGATEAQRQFVGNEYRFVVNEDRGVRSQYANPMERIFYTNLTDVGTANALLARMVQIYGTERRIYRGTFYELAFKVKLGDVVNLTYDRYGIGGSMLVVGIGEDARTGQTTLELFK